VTSGCSGSPVWNRTSLNERYDWIEIPTFVIGGWYDQYPDSLLRIVQHLKAPRKAIIGWPLERAREQILYPQPGHSLGASAPAKATHALRYVPTVGVENGLWSGEVVRDQRPIDAYSLVYDTQPLEDDLEILGMPRVMLNASADAPLARWFVRLSDVAPDGTVTQTSWAGFNGAHRKSAENPEPLEPGRVYPLEIELRFTSWTFPKGHRIRLSVNNAQVTD